MLPWADSGLRKGCALGWLPLSLFLRSAMDLLVMAGWWEPVRGLLVAVAGPFSPRRRRARVKHGEPGLLGGEVLLGSDSSVLRGRKVDDALPQHAGRRETGDGGRRVRCCCCTRTWLEVTGLATCWPTLRAEPRLRIQDAFEVRAREIKPWRSGCRETAMDVRMLRPHVISSPLAMQFHSQAFPSSTPRAA